MATITTPAPGRFGRPGTAPARGVRVGRGWRRLLSPLLLVLLWQIEDTFEAAS